MARQKGGRGGLAYINARAVRAGHKDAPNYLLTRIEDGNFFGQEAYFPLCLIDVTAISFP